MYRKILLIALTALTFAGKCRKKTPKKNITKESYILDSDQEPVPLSAAWEADINELPDIFIEAREKLKEAVKRLTEPARKSLKRILDFIEDRKVQGELLYDIATFPLKKLVEILVIVAKLEIENPEVMKEICKEREKASFWAKMKLHALENSLSPEEQKLFDELEEKLAIKNLPDSDF